VARFNTAFGHFLALSIALHMAALIIVNLLPKAQVAPPDPIAVSLLPPRERPTIPAVPAPKAAPAPHASKASKAPPPVARKEPAVVKELRETPVPPRDRSEAIARQREEPLRREPKVDNAVVVERPLPSLKELLPPVNYASSGERNSAISLNTKDPLYVSYFTKIKQNIEQHWEYPEVALRYGLQGRLSLEFTIGGGGQLEQLRMIRSSGSQVLDEEALRAIKAAAPFPPIPSWIKTVPLFISASMEYHDNRVYQFAR
jgi:protein TonB